MKALHLLLLGGGSVLLIECLEQFANFCRHDLGVLSLHGLQS